MAGMERPTPMPPAPGTPAGAKPVRAASATRPPVVRRDKLGAAGAPSWLMTLLGECVLPGGGAAWTATLLAALDGLGVEERSARQALARSAADGRIDAERVGRRTRWVITASGRRLLTEGAERIYSFGAPRPEWDGTWLVLMVTVPESRRKVRHQLRTKLTWAGFGSPAPGLWIGPDPGRAAEAAGILGELGLDAPAFSFRGAFGGIGSERAMVDQAWDLAEIAERYRAFLDEFSDLRPTTRFEVLLAQLRLVHEWRRFPLLDPQLPSALLPAHWIGDRAAGLFARLHAEWGPRARAAWAELAEEAAA
ncbi:PaaX family transcriptional regulator (plasmid) [Embleya sp. NBC_00896]|nr:PaaX family transcriptional regulator [Embleya sp. NBC_00896]